MSGPFWLVPLASKNSAQEDEKIKTNKPDPTKNPNKISEYNKISDHSNKWHLLQNYILIENGDFSGNWILFCTERETQLISGL